MSTNEQPVAEYIETDYFHVRADAASLRDFLVLGERHPIKRISDRFDADYRRAVALARARLAALEGEPA